MTAPDNSSAVRALTWNVQQSSGTRIDEQIRFIASTRADVVVLQEAYRGEVEHFRNGLAAATGRSWEARYAPAVRRSDRNEGAGVVILSAFPVLATDSIQMPYPDTWTASRPALRVRIDAAGAPLDVITTHLAAGEEGSESRRHQIRRLVEWVTASNTAALLGGDFNAEPQTPEVASLAGVFADAWIANGHGAGETFSSDRPTRRIDYWFASLARGGVVSSTDISVLDVCAGHGCLSDHKALLAVFHINR